MMIVVVAAINTENELIYIVLGIDENEHDQVLAVFNSYTDAKRYCCQTMHDTVYYDLWIEKHPVMYIRFTLPTLLDQLWYCFNSYEPLRTGLRTISC